ncbi:MAG TPA: hypothetical protein PLT43_03900 [Mesotoga sp.]|jgi:hypothetical protein|nr:hypothetical protein [Mesotoga sp.]
MTTKTLKPRPQDADFQTRLKSLCLEYGISFHVFAGEYEKTSVQKEGRAVVSLAGSVEKILRIVYALNDLMPGVIVNGVVREISKITCKDCPDRDTCPTKDLLTEGRRCNA